MVLSISPLVAWSEHGDRVYALHAGDSVPLALDSSACETWIEIAESSPSRQELISSLAAMFDADPAAISPDVEALLSVLIDRGYLLEQDGPKPR